MTITMARKGLLAAGLVGLGLALATAAAAPAMAETAKTTPAADSHGHSHGADDIYKGYFDDSQIQPRALSDWEGEWQSVYPLLVAGKLDPVMAHKAESGEKSAAEYRSYYETGYKTDVDRITIAGEKVTFHRADGAVTGEYAQDGQEVLTYEKGNRGVRYVFTRTGGDAEAPAVIQFSDHKIAPAPADHYHLYWGEDRAKLLEELTNWPTYYPAALSVDEIVHEMTAH